MTASWNPVNVKRVHIQAGLSYTWPMSLEEMKGQMSGNTRATEALHCVSEVTVSRGFPSGNAVVTRAIWDIALSYGRESSLVALIERLRRLFGLESSL